MWLSIVTLLYVMDIILQCGGLNIGNLPIRDKKLMTKYHKTNNPRYIPSFLSILRNSSANIGNGTQEEHKDLAEKVDPSTTLDPSTIDPMKNLEQEQDNTLKRKIDTLADQTIHDTEIKMESIQYLKDKYESQIHYKAGFLLSMIKKSRDMLNELFHVAVKHRDDWKTLELMKILELIVHTNEETNNLVKQLVELHSNAATSTTKNKNIKRI